MVFSDISNEDIPETERQSQQVQINMCKELIRNKLPDCGSASQWDSNTLEGCSNCFDATNTTNLQLCDD